MRTFVSVLVFVNLVSGIQWRGDDEVWYRHIERWKGKDRGRKDSSGDIGLNVDWSKYSR